MTASTHSPHRIDTPTSASRSRRTSRASSAPGITEALPLRRRLPLERATLCRDPAIGGPPMSTVARPQDGPGASAGTATVDLKLEVGVLPVADVGRAKDFYTGLGWRLDADVATGDDFRVVQVTPPGSPASVIFGTNVTAAAPGTAQGLHLIVSDIAAARAYLAARGADVSVVFHDAGGVFHHGG